METRIKICVDFEDDIYYSAQYKGWFIWHEIGKSYPRYCGGEENALIHAKNKITQFLATKKEINLKVGTIIRYPLHRDD